MHFTIFLYVKNLITITNSTYANIYYNIKQKKIVVYHKKTLALSCYLERNNFMIVIFNFYQPNLKDIKSSGLL